MGCFGSDDLFIQMDNVSLIWSLSGTLNLSEVNLSRSSSDFCGGSNSVWILKTDPSAAIHQQPLINCKH